MNWRLVGIKCKYGKTLYFTLTIIIEIKEKIMTKDVVVSLKGLQLAPDEQSDAVEVIAPGEYYIRNDKHYVLFEEIMEGENNTSKNMLKFNKDCLEFTRKGPMSVHMIFEKGKKNLTYYYTPFGSIQIGIDATGIEVSETDDEITAEVKYALDVNYEYVGDCHITIAVRKKGMAVNIV